MTKKEEQLLLKDLCARLPYGVKVKYYSMEYPYGSDPKTLTPYLLYDRWEKGEVKAYLRPLSSMTEEERTEYLNACDNDDDALSSPRYSGIDWLNAHYFDYRDLIPLGLALEAPEGMYD